MNREQFMDLALDGEHEDLWLAYAELEARLGRAAEALRMLWDHYLLVITDEQKAQVLAVLAEQEKEQQ